MMQQTGIRRELEADDKSAGASLRPAVDWHSINWRRANRNVRRLQRRIVEAQQQGKKRKVRAAAIYPHSLVQRTLSCCPTNN
jgi:N-terminal domain of reverse transcriptase